MSWTIEKDGTIWCRTTVQPTEAELAAYKAGGYRVKCDGKPWPPRSPRPPAEAATAASRKGGAR